VHTALMPMADFAISTALVLILALFILIRREDMRNRIIRLWGQRKLRQATEALDDAGRRIGSFLLMQLAVNVSFGVCFSAGLFLAPPLTAIGLVLARHIRPLHFIEVLLGDEPALKPRQAIYQRLLAKDREEIKRVLSDYEKKHPDRGAAETLLLSVLQMIE